jgi:uncharacterized protein YgiM (DUF1202 family)
MSKRNNKNIFKNTFRRHSNGVLYIIIFLLVAIITAGAIVMSNMETKKLEDANTTVTTVAPTTKKKVVEEKTEEATTEEETTEEETSAGKLKVTTETINIRSKPSEDGELIAQAEYDDVFEVIKKKGDWYQINFNGVKGYVSAELVEEID